MEKISEFKPNLVFNCAGFTNVDKAEENRSTADNVNGYAVGFVAKACKEIGAIMVHYSTGMVFDGSNSAGYNEIDRPNPVNAYGRSKLLGEIELQKNTDMFYLIRTCWLYGPPAGGKKSFTDIILELAGKNETISAVIDEFGSPTYTLDLAQISRALIEEQKPCGIYHSTNAGTASRYDWAKGIFNIKKIQANLVPMSGEFFKRKAIRPKYEVLNNNKYIQLRPWTEALKEYLEKEKVTSKK